MKLLDSKVRGLPDKVLRENIKLAKYKRLLSAYVSDKNLIKKLLKYMNQSSSITTCEKDWIIRAVKRTRIGDEVTAKAIIKRSRSLSSLVKKVIYIEPEEDWIK